MGKIPSLLKIIRRISQKKDARKGSMQNGIYFKVTKHRFRFLPFE